jgi:hypothetical protein
MTTRGATAQGALAALALIAAYTSWQKEPERPPGEVVLLDIGKGELTKVRYEDDKKWVELTPAKEDGERLVWMKVSARPEAKAPEREVRGGEGALKLIEKLEPMRAARGLGALAADKLKELGLEAPKKKLTVSARGSSYTFHIGASPFGVSDPYVKDDRDGKVYVLGGTLLADLDAAAVRLVDRQVHTFKPTDFDALVISAGGKKRELVQTNIDEKNPFAAKFAPKAAPDKSDALAKNWHDKLWRMVTLEALGKGEKPAAGEPPVAVRVDYSHDGKPKGWVELGRVVPTAPPPPANTSAPPPPAPPVEVYVRSEHSAGWLKLPATADEVIKEADKVASEQ